MDIAKILEKLKDECKIYLNNPIFVFKKCGEFIVVLEKPEDVLCNEMRTGIIDKNFAKFRANGLWCKFIIHFKTFACPTKIRHDVVYGTKNIVYKIGEFITPDDYNKDIEKVCTNGIHYFLTLEAAFYYNLIPFCGRYQFHTENGRLYAICNYRDFELHGEMIEWYANGNIENRSYYEHARKHGLQLKLDEDGWKVQESQFVNGFKISEVNYENKK